MNTSSVGGILLLLTAVTTGTNVTIVRDDYVPLLTCIDEIRGVLEGVDYDQPSRVVDCGRSVGFCQKITGHYMSATAETEILMRGCDSIQIEGQFNGVQCKKEGCYEETISLETYNICCCSSNMCNTSSRHRYAFLITALFAACVIRI